MLESLEAFQKAAEKEMKTAEGSLKMLIGALLAIEKDKKLAAQMLTVVLSKKSLVPDKSKNAPLKVKPEPAIKRLIDHMGFKPNIVRSYAGGTPENGYKCDLENPKVPVIKAIYSDDKKDVEFLVQSSGKDSYTPLKFGISNEGIWKFTGKSGGLSSLATGVKNPVEDPRDI